MTAIIGSVNLDGGPALTNVFQAALGEIPLAECSGDEFIGGALAFGYRGNGWSEMSRQPLAEGALTIVADARIYNRNDIIRDLDCRPFEPLCDAGLIMHAYQRWGPRFLHRINGDFGIAIYDGRTKELFLARDHIGVRPLFWTRRANRVMFSSFLHGLVGFRDFQWPLSEKRIARYLCNPYDIRLESFIDGVEAVGPGQWVRISAEKVIRQRWWDPGAIATRANISSDEAQETLRSLTRAAIEARLPDNARVGSHCSGGIDSTLVTIIASQALKARGSNLTAAYTWSPPVDERYPDMGEADERRVIASQCAELGVPVRYGTATPQTFEDLISQPMELQGTADLMDELPVIAKARNDGIRVMLSGWGGDEAFSSHGNGHVAWLIRQGRLRQAIRLARRIAGGLRRPHEMVRYLWRAGIVPMLPEPFYRHFQPFVDIYGDGAFPSEYMKALDRQSSPARELRLLPDGDAYMRQMLNNGHIAERMATWAAWSAPAGFEYRYPLVDKHLLEFLLSLPPDIRFGDGSGRYLARRAFNYLLPKGLRKHDLANERLRSDNRQGWWDSVRNGRARMIFASANPWVEFDRLQAALERDLSPHDKIVRISIISRVFEVVRICAVADRSKEKRGSA